MMGIGGKEISVANTYAIPRKEFTITYAFSRYGYVDHQTKKVATLQRQPL
jgi:hypothetical protein